MTLPDCITKITYLLNTRDDWEEWDLALRHLARDVNGLEFLLGTKTPMELPDLPEIEQPRQPPAPAARGNARSQAPAEQPAGEAAGVSTRSRTAAATEGIGICERIQYYELVYQRYLRDETAVRQLRQFMQETVAKHLQFTCFQPEKSVADWYKNLKDFVECC